MVNWNLLPTTPKKSIASMLLGVLAILIFFEISLSIIQTYISFTVKHIRANCCVWVDSSSLLFIYSLSDSIKLTGLIFLGNVIVKSNLKLEFCYWM
jgi:hypothetical protein